MAYDDVSSVQFINDRKVDIEKLNSEEADALITEIDEKVKNIEEELEKILFGDESEAIN